MKRSENSGKHIRIWDGRGDGKMSISATDVLRSRCGRDGEGTEGRDIREGV